MIRRPATTIAAGDDQRGDRVEGDDAGDFDQQPARPSTPAKVSASVRRCAASPSRAGDSWARACL